MSNFCHRRKCQKWQAARDLPRVLPNDLISVISVITPSKTFLDYLSIGEGVTGSGVDDSNDINSRSPPCHTPNFAERMIRTYQQRQQEIIDRTPSRQHRDLVPSLVRARIEATARFGPHSPVVHRLNIALATRTPARIRMAIAYLRKSWPELLEVNP